jgi:RecA-family ATPase
MVPEKAITSITAASGKGKSLLALIMAYYIGKGELLFGERDFEVKKSKVLIIDGEMNFSTITGRYKGVFQQEKLPVDFILEQNWLISDEQHF